jgi:hypothetical protein
VFRDARQAELDALNAARPPGEVALALWRVVRHACPDVGGASIGISLRERYRLSPAYWVCYCGAVGEHGIDFPHWDCQGGKVVAADGQFAFIWKEGGCSGCGLVVRTRTGRFIASAADRPPDHGRAIHA